MSHRRDPNFISLKEHLKEIRAEHTAAHGREHAMLAEAVNKAETLMGARLETLSTVANNQEKAINERLSAVERTLAQLAGKSGGTAQTIAFVFAAVGLVSTLISIFFALSGR